MRSLFNGALWKVLHGCCLKHNPPTLSLVTDYTLNLYQNEFLPFTGDLLPLLPLWVPGQVLDDVRAAVQHQLAASQLLLLLEGLEVVLGEQDAPSPCDHPLPPPWPSLDIRSLPLPTLLPIPRSKTVAPVLSNLDCVHLERKQECWGSR